MIAVIVSKYGVMLGQKARSAIRCIKTPIE